MKFLYDMEEIKEECTSVLSLLYASHNERAETLFGTLVVDRALNFKRNKKGSALHSYGDYFSHTLIFLDFGFARLIDMS